MREISKTEKAYYAAEAREAVAGALDQALGDAERYLNADGDLADLDELASASIRVAKVLARAHARTSELLSQLSPEETDFAGLATLQATSVGHNVFAFEARDMEPGSTWQCDWTPYRHFQPKRLLISPISRDVEILALKVGNQQTTSATFGTPLGCGVFESEMLGFMPVAAGMSTALTIRNPTDRRRDFHGVVIGRYLSDRKYRERLAEYETSAGAMFGKSRPIKGQ